MNQDFTTSASGNPAQPSAPRLVFVSDCQGTLFPHRFDPKTPSALLELLGDAANAGHRVIITSSLLDKDMVTDCIEIMARHFPKGAVDTTKFEMVPKFQLFELKGDDGEMLAPDYVFDDQPIAYLESYGVHIRTIPDTGTPVPGGLTFGHVRALAGLPSKDGTGPAQVMAPSAP